MTKRGKFGDRPGLPDDELDVATRAGAPLPLVTQPMAAVHPGSVPGSGPVARPGSMPGSGPVARPGSAPGTGPGTVPAARPGSAPGISGPGALVAGRPLAHTLPLSDDDRAVLDPGRATLEMQRVSPAAIAAARESRPVDPPPEIGLTQHHLPDDATPDPRLILHLEPDSERAAQFRVLRHHLLEVGRPQVVVVTSATAGEGKTTAAINLALALAECGRAKVLLVETHLRRPQLAGVFRFVPPWCFAEQLAAHRHQPMLPWGLVDIPQLWLHVAAVNPRTEPAQLLDAPAFAIAMERLRLGGYDHIVIDAPPISGSAEVNLLQDAADGVLLVARGGTTTARSLRRALDQISATKVLGTVLLET